MQIRSVDKVIEHYVCEKIFKRVPIISEIYSMVEKYTPQMLAIKIGEAMIGIREEGNNSGKLVESIQRTIGRSEREAWCMSSQQCIEAIVEKWLRVKSSLYVSEHCLTVFKHADKIITLDENPQVNDLAIYCKLVNGERTSMGHVARIMVDGDSTFKSLEGNTSDSSGVNREGDGFYSKYRDLDGSRNMPIIGFIRPNYVSVE